MTRGAISQSRQSGSTPESVLEVIDSCNRVLDSIVTRKENTFEMFDQIFEHFHKLTGTSMMSLVVKLVVFSKFESNDKKFSKGITELREIK